MADNDDMLFRARVDIGPYEHINTKGEKVVVEADTWYGKIREKVGLARGDATRKHHDLTKWSLAGKNGAVITKSLEACLIPEWRVVE